MEAHLHTWCHVNKLWATTRLFLIAHETRKQEKNNKEKFRNLERVKIVFKKNYKQRLIAILVMQHSFECASVDACVYMSEWQVCLWTCIGRNCPSWQHDVAESDSDILVQSAHLVRSIGLLTEATGFGSTVQSSSSVPNLTMRRSLAKGNGVLM